MTEPREDTVGTEAVSDDVLALVRALEWLLVPWGHAPPERGLPSQPAVPYRARVHRVDGPPADAKVWGNRGDTAEPRWEPGGVAHFGGMEAELRLDVHPRTGALHFGMGGDSRWVLGERGAKAVELCAKIAAGGWAVQRIAADGVELARLPLPAADAAASVASPLQ